MASFWGLSDGGDAKDTGKEFNAGGGALEVIPKGTGLLAMIVDAGWKEWNDTEYLNVKWSVLKPAAYEGRVLFQKIYVSDDKPGAKDPKAARDKALRMLAAIDANSGGKLARKAGKPTNDDFAVALTNKQMVVTVEIWDKEDDNGKKVPGGNWIRQVAPKGPVQEVEAASRKSAPPVDLDDDAPF